MSVCTYCKTELKGHKPTYRTYYGEQDGVPSDGIEHNPERCRDALKLRVTALESALEDGIELADEGWAYADEYYKKKWSFAESIEKLRKALKGEK